MDDLDNWFLKVDAVRDDIIALNQALVRIPSVNTGLMPAGNETEVCEYVQRWLRCSRATSGQPRGSTPLCSP